MFDNNQTRKKRKTGKRKKNLRSIFNKEI